MSSPLDCPDCTGAHDHDQVLRHDHGCPISTALEAMSATDRAWFEAHPGAGEYWRDLLPGDLGVSCLDSVVLGTTDGRPARVRVRQIEPGVRLRSMPGNLVIRLDTLDGARVGTLFTTAATLTREWVDRLRAAG